MTILVCTVGGSHEPILEAIRSVEPESVFFVCTNKDPGTGAPGSRQQIEGQGLVIKRHPRDDKPTLANIPTQAGLDNHRWQIKIVPPDDLDANFERLHKLLAELRRSRPDERLVVDYTGGTKTMTAAAILVGLEFEQVDLQFVSGARSDLQRVRSGTQTASTANAECIRLRRAMAPYLQAWRRFAYDEAAKGLKELNSPSNDSSRTILIRATQLSAAFGHWDRFDHKAAFEAIETFRPAVAPHGFAEYFAALKVLISEGHRREPARLLDLWCNAERRAAQRRYDDAVARCYRLLEWSAQYLLSRDADIDTSNVPRDKFAPDMSLQPNPHGVYQAGLFNAWALVSHHLGGEPGSFFDTQHSTINDLLQGRNRSILAHGDIPVNRGVWQRWEAWITQEFLPMLLNQTKKDGLHKPPPQLPDHFPEALLTIETGGDI